MRSYVLYLIIIRSLVGTSDTYNAQATAGDINKALTNHKVFVPSYLSAYIAIVDVLHIQNLESSSTSLLVFGNGDGGGGPLAKMLESVCLSLLPTPSL